MDFKGLFIYIYMCMPTFIYVPQVCRCPNKPEEDVGSPETVQLGAATWEWNQGHLQ